MENKLKHLDFLQAVITRMNSNSFLVKGWAVTLVSGLSALAAKDSNIDFALISYIVIPGFWVLDGFFIATERRYRDLYDEVRKKDANNIDFSMDISTFNGKGRSWIEGIFSKTLLPFYLVLIIC